MRKLHQVTPIVGGCALEQEWLFRVVLSWVHGSGAGVCTSISWSRMWATLGQGQDLASLQQSQGWRWQKDGAGDMAVPVGYPWGSLRTEGSGHEGGCTGRAPQTHIFKEQFEVAFSGMDLHNGCSSERRSCWSSKGDGIARQPKASLWHATQVSHHHSVAISQNSLYVHVLRCYFNLDKAIT